MLELGILLAEVFLGLVLEDCLDDVFFLLDHVFQALWLVRDEPNDEPDGDENRVLKIVSQRFTKAVLLHRE
jgi:hypothetical protein